MKLNCYFTRAAKPKNITQIEIYFMEPTFFENDAQLLAAFSGTDRDRQLALAHFFENPNLLKWVIRHVQRHGGNEQDAKDVFEEAFIIFERQLFNH